MFAGHSGNVLDCEVRYDLTTRLVAIGLDWSPRLWIARLASRAWEDNGLDVPECFLDSLVSFLGEPSS